MQKRKKIAVVGSEGYVGKGMVNFFKDHYTVVKHDISLGKKSAPKYKVNKCDLAVICVPTPMAKDGSCDTSIVEEVLSWIKIPIWIRSTVSVGFTQKYERKGYKICFSPEYMGEGKYWMPWKFHTDEKEIPWFILGGIPAATSYVLDLIVPITGPTKYYRQMSSKSAEMAKYMENIYFAMKVVFANEFRRACDKLKVDYWEARDGWGLDPRVDKMHTAVFPSQGGFGGRCLPKDLMAFIKTCEKASYEPKFLKQIWESNKYFAFSYRNSILKQTKEIVLQAKLRYNREEPEELLRKQEEILKLRNQKHPTTDCSAGCFFKNIEKPDEPYGKLAAGFLLEKVGAKEMQIGGAGVFERHANILINSSGTASAADVRKLAEILKKRVKDKFGYNLEEEITFLGD